MWYYEWLFVSFGPREGGRPISESYQIFRTKETVNVLIPCTLIIQRANLQINIGAVPVPTLSPRSRPVSRPASSWSTIEEVESSPPSYQVVLARRFGARPVDYPVEKEEVDDPTYEHPEPIYAPESRQELRGNTDFFTDSVDSTNVSHSGRGGVQYVTPFPRGRGLFKRPFFKKSRNSDN